MQLSGFMVHISQWENEPSWHEGDGKFMSGVSHHQSIGLKADFLIMKVSWKHANSLAKRARWQSRVDLTPGLLGPWDTYLQPKISTFRGKKKRQGGGNKLLDWQDQILFFFFGPLTSMEEMVKQDCWTRKGGWRWAHWTTGQVTFLDLFKRH